MGIASDLKDDVLATFDNHLSNTRRSLAAARKSADQIQQLVNPRKGKDKTMTSNSHGGFKFMHNGNMKRTQEKVANLKPGIGSQENIHASPTERCQHVSVLTSASNNVRTEAAPKARRIISCTVDVNYNAPDPALNQDSRSSIEDKLPETDDLDPRQPEEDVINYTLPQEVVADDTHQEEGFLDQTVPGEEVLNDELPEHAFLGQGNEETTVLIEAPDTDAETVQEMIVQPDLLPTPFIMVTSATPFELESEEVEEVKPDPLAARSEIRVGKRVSFNDSAIEEVILISQDTEDTAPRRFSLDGNILPSVEKRKHEDDTGRVSLKRAQSSDIVVKAATKVLEELRQAKEAEESAKVDAGDQNVEAESISNRSEHIKIDVKDSLLMIEKRSFRGSETDQLDRDKSELTIRSEFDGASMTDEATGAPRSLTQVLKSIDKVIYKDGVAMVWKKLSFTDQDVLVPVPPNSMLSEHTKSNQSLSTGEKDTPKHLPKESCDAFVKRVIGPAAFRHMFKKPKPPPVKSKVRGADWAQQIKTQTFSAKPPVLYLQQWKINKMKKNYLGPGCYEFKDFIQLGNAKPRSERGICDKLGPRFDKMAQSVTPGPGTYGIGGIPHKALEDHANRSFSTKGILDAGDRKRNLPFQGSCLAPGTYEHRSFVEELLNKVTSLKGPYQLFSGKRNEPLRTGFYAAPKRTKIGPGYYSFKSFVDELADSKYNLRGRFTRQAQYPAVPTERFVLVSKATASLDKDTPGPGAYDVKDLPRYTSAKPPGFLSSSRRDDKATERVFAVTSNSVGPGRYSTEKFEEPRVNGHTNVFKSKTGKPSLRMARFYEERLKIKQRNDETRCSCPGGPHRSIIGM